MQYGNKSDRASVKNRDCACGKTLDPKVECPCHVGQIVCVGHCDCAERAMPVRILHMPS